MLENKKNNLSKWYAINVYPSFENKVVINLKNLKLKDVFEVISVEQNKFSNSNKKIKKINSYPGYIFVNMILSNEILSVLKSIPGIISYSLQKKLIPISFDEMESVLKRNGQIDENMYFNYNIGDFVKIISGPFLGNKGKIISINKKSGWCKIEVFFLGKYIPMEIEFVNVEKI